MSSTDTILTVPPDLRWDTDHVRPDYYDLSWPPADEPSRLVTKNYSNQVVVCLPHADFPRIMGGTGIFYRLSTSTLDFDIDAIADLLETVPESFDGADPTRCWFGVKYGNVQTFGNSTSYLLGDLLSITDTPARADGFGSGPTPHAFASGGRPKSTLVAACWPLGDYRSWFVLEGQRFEGIDPPRFLWDYGLLFADLPIEPKGYIDAFFDPLTDDPPTYVTQWARRQLIVEPRPLPPPLTHAVPIDGGLVHKPATLTLHVHGTNPLYGTPPETVGDRGETLDSILYNPLQGTSTLLYDLAGRERSEDGYELETLVVIDTPTERSVFVLAEVGPHWG